MVILLAMYSPTVRPTMINLYVRWITQLVVDRNYRERGLVVILLNHFMEDGIDIYGLMSSHPAACLAAA